MKRFSQKTKQYLFTVPGFLQLAFWLSISGMLTCLVDYGFDQSGWLQVFLFCIYFVVILVGIVATGIRHLYLKRVSETKVKVFDLITVSFSIFIVVVHIYSWFSGYKNYVFRSELWLNLAVFLTFVREISERRVKYSRRAINPAQLFILSFIGIVFLGALALQLPNATVHGISFLDALFTSTSAVCVTGLITVDTGTYFTQFGQVIIMILIQVGGVGILTFASYFSYFFKGGSSYENQLTIGEMSNVQKLGEVYSILKRILMITFIIELIGAVFIFFSLNPDLFASFGEHTFFSIFHSISSFCNAGFSTLSNGLYDSSFRYNYAFQLSIIFLFVLGGLGFPIVVNILKFFKYFVLNRVLFFVRGVRNYRPWVLNLNSRITLITTLILTVAGTILFYLGEYNNTLAEHGTFGKIVTALFGATTPRTAGFNTIDMGALHFSTVMLIFLLMWIGASPASTGGGIKTSTIAIAVLNIVSLARGKTRIEIYRREIADISVKRAFAVITLSLLVIGVGIILISISDKDKDLLSIAFECFSAYSTVGLSVGITSDLSSFGKVVILVIMFIGRVSMLSMMIAIFRKVKHKNYRYPTEEITIN